VNVKILRGNERVAIRIRKETTEPAIEYRILNEFHKAIRICKETTEPAIEYRILIVFHKGVSEKKVFQDLQ
jgi:hypothetical protein